MHCKHFENKRKQELEFSEAAAEFEAINTELQPATSCKFSSPGTNAGPPGLWTRVSRLDGDLAGRSCAGSFLEASPQLCVQCKVGLPARNHSTIRATFMWDKSIMCLWNFC